MFQFTLLFILLYISNINLAVKSTRSGRQLNDKWDTKQQKAIYFSVNWDAKIRQLRESVD